MNENTHKKNCRARNGQNLPVTFIYGDNVSEDEVMELERRRADDWLSPRASERARIRIRWLS